MWGPWTLKIKAWRPGGSVGQWSQIRIPLMKSRIRIRIEVRSWIQIRVKVKSWIQNLIKAMRIRDPALKDCASGRTRVLV